MRAFNGQDLFNGLRFFKVAGIRERIKPVVLEAAEKGVNPDDVGFDVIFGAIGAIAEEGAEAQLWKLLSGPFEMDPEEAKHLPLNELSEKIMWLWKDGGGKDFFTQLSNMISLKSLN